MTAAQRENGIAQWYPCAGRRRRLMMMAKRENAMDGSGKSDGRVGTVDDCNRLVNVNETPYQQA